MNRKKERLLWLVISTILLVALVAFSSAPTATAQTIQSDQTRQYIRELESIIYILKNNYVDDIESEDLFKGAIEGIFSSLDDPYSTYLDSDFLQSLMDTTKGKFGGVGLYINREKFDPEKPNGRMPYVKVVSPMQDTPAWKAGINAGDYIYAIEGVSAEDYSTQDVSDKLRGKPGTRVNVTILRNKDMTFNVMLTRAIIEIPTTKATIINNQTGYLRISQFTPYTAPQVKKHLRTFLDANLEELIIDVRSNPGGLLDSVVEVADFFFSEGTLVSTQYRQDSQNKIHRATAKKIVPDNMKIVVLINEGSASASEILTGALKDRGRAMVIGEKSYGKGSIQQMIPLQTTEAAIKLTTGRYYTPNGKTIDKIGIEPDIESKEPELSDEAQKAFMNILKDNRIGIFVDKHPKPSQTQIGQFIAQLHKEGLLFEDRNLRILVKREIERRQNVPPVVDLEYDSQLIRALQFLRTGR